MKNLELHSNHSFHHGQFEIIENNNLFQLDENNIEKIIQINDIAIPSFKKVNSMSKTLKSIIKKIIASNEVGAVLMVQLVGQQQLTDLFGSHLGEASMEFVKSQINRCLRLEDYMEQVSADEFAVVLGSLKEPNEATVIAHRIIDGCVGEQAVEDQSIYIMATVKIKAIPSSDKR